MSQEIVMGAPPSSCRLPSQPSIFRLFRTTNGYALKVVEARRSMPRTQFSRYDTTAPKWPIGSIDAIERGPSWTGSFVAPTD